MKSPKEVRDLLLLWQVLADELASRCCTSTARDYETITSRTKHEGLSFLTITLPTFGKDLHKALDRGWIDSSLFQGFKWKGGLPAFLSGFLSRVFCPTSGRLLDEPDLESVFAVRQLTLLFGKILIPTTPEREVKALRKFIETDLEVKHHDRERTVDDYDEFTRMSRLLWTSTLCDMDRMVYEHRLLPKHGPGATADRLRGNQKFVQREWPARLERVFPYGEYVLPSVSYWRQYYDVDRVHFHEPGAERPVKVTAVPKTLDTPRLIAIEPTAMQYMQQAIATSLVRIIDDGNDSPPSGFLGFRNRVPNQILARIGSRDGTLATLDLSEASDRVSNQLVRAMLKDFPWLLAAVDSCRSRKAAVDLPEGQTIVRLGKFASMGSALTFPIEAMVFLTCAMIGIERAGNRRLTPWDVQSLKGRVRVYGDDIIVPVEYVREVVDALEHFGAKVNINKSFWTGKFRESCGGDFYAGEDVSIVRVRRLFPARPRDVMETVSLVSLRNRMYHHGLWRTARYLDGVIEKLIKVYPTISQDSPTLGRHTYLPLRFHTSEPVKWDTDLQTLLVRGYVVETTLPESHLDDVWALQKVFLSAAHRDQSRSLRKEPLDWLSSLLEDEPVLDVDHLERHGRPDAVDIKLRYTALFPREGGRR
jgi:hypothetical protein